MNEQQRQAVSALLDGELEAPQAGQVIDALERDPELRALWERYHLIGGALRREGGALAWRDIAGQTRARIAAEPTVLAPTNLRRRRPSRAASFAGVALAASAAFLAVFAVPALFNPEVSSLPRTAATLPSPAPADPPEAALQTRPGPARSICPGQGGRPLRPEPSPALAYRRARDSPAPGPVAGQSPGVRPQHRHQPHAPLRDAGQLWHGSLTCPWRCRSSASGLNAWPKP